MDKKLQEIGEVIEKYLLAGEILSTVREEAREKIKVGAKLLDVADFVEQRTIELGGFPAFPCNISRNDEAAHATPVAGDETIFGETVEKLDLGVHIDGFIADSAITVDLTNENAELVKAAEAALYAAIDTVADGVNTAQLGAVIEDTIHEHGFRPIVNLTGHGVGPYLAHVPPSIPNRHIDHGTVLETGDVIAIEPFATDGTGRIADGALTEIYSMVAKKPIRLPAVRKVLNEIETYGTLPFAKRWLNGDKLDYSLMQLEKAGIITSYPVLKEVGGGLVSQAEHTVIVTDDGCEVTTK